MGVHIRYLVSPHRDIVRGSLYEGSRPTPGRGRKCIIHARFFAGGSCKKYAKIQDGCTRREKTLRGHHDCCPGDKTMQQWRRLNVVIPRRSCEIFALREFRRETIRPRNNFVEIRRNNKFIILSVDPISTFLKFERNETSREIRG